MTEPREDTLAPGVTFVTKNIYSSSNGPEATAEPFILTGFHAAVSMPPNSQALTFHPVWAGTDK